MSPKAETPKADVRARMAADLERVYDEKVSTFFNAALDAEKSISVSCQHCRRKTKADVPDWAARVRALELLINQGYGRLPNVGADEQDVTLVVERSWPFMGDDLASLFEGNEPAGIVSTQTLQELEHIRGALLEAGWMPPPEPVLAGVSNR